MLPSFSISVSDDVNTNDFPMQGIYHVPVLIQILEARSVFKIETMVKFSCILWISDEDYILQQ